MSELFGLSVIVATHNCPNYVARLLNGLQGQDLSWAEIIISDDASTDDTVEVASDIIADGAFGDHVRVVANERWGHAGSARNIGLRHSKGEWVWNFDADDFILPDAIRRIVAFCKTVADKCDCVYIPHRELQEAGAACDYLAECRMAPAMWRCAPWAKVVRRAKAELVPFREGAHYEDCDWWYAMADVLDYPECLPGPPCMVYDRTTGGSVDGLEWLQQNRECERYALYELVEDGVLGANVVADYLALVEALVRLHGRVRREQVKQVIVQRLKVLGDFVL